MNKRKKCSRRTQRRRKEKNEKVGQESCAREKFDPLWFLFVAHVELGPRELFFFACDSGSGNGALRRLVGRPFLRLFPLNYGRSPASALLHPLHWNL